jgi:hypothetical protein
MSFVYNLRPNTALIRSAADVQFTFPALNEPTDTTDYHLDRLLTDHLVVAQNAPHGYVPLKVGLAAYKQVDDTDYFMVYQPVGQKLTIVPVSAVELTDTQFTESEDTVSITRTMLGTLFGMGEEVLEIELNFDNAFEIFDEGTFVFTTKVEVAKEDAGDVAGKFKMESYGLSIGFVTLEEIIQDEDAYDYLSVQYAKGQS